MKKEKHGEGLVVSDTICPTTTAGQEFPSPREEKVAEALLNATRGIAARPVQNAKARKMKEWQWTYQLDGPNYNVHHLATIRL